MTSALRDRLCLLAPVIAVGIAAVVAPPDDGPTMCPFALCTGLACPGCGLTRAVISLVRGDLGTAAAYHPLVFLFAVEGLAAWLWFLIRRRDLIGPISRPALNLVLGGTVVALIGVWIARMATGTLPPV